ncbi:hypothetical protein FH041_08915 [Pseudomonas sp. SWI7]|uniref:hypothetical protein n=1 Tax=Pseudomonas sp. SWI7 TaxID=2587597 RepID=UPI00111EB2AB|nr:hypothetical protein [Pseudomonas sp. SWI7]QDC05044.1 hypothetical protein FH041_08915 [Pseudomonas sp. SWI7]
MTSEEQFIDLVRLEQLAESATKGEWKCAKRADGRFWHIGNGNQAIGATHAASSKCNPVQAAVFEANARFIAAAHPAVILALVAEIKALRLKVDGQ